ncbi:uncharacterized protein LOC113341156 [Papaver somniferum]|uniref:uncharacterized protein LOC113341156 n=1 Tax=Papaver somniferum TaxID=3469 RepID=UPI000E6F525A|nr:uncharacterized protein LOC113341156 [Papaver somniferum]
MAKLFCASPIFVAASILLLITVSVSSVRDLAQTTNSDDGNAILDLAMTTNLSGDGNAVCYFDGGYIGQVIVATSKISCPRCKRNCLGQCGRSKYTTVHNQCDTIASATLQCYCCCSNVQKLSFTSSD